MNDVIKADKRIKLNGNSLVVHLTSEVKLMGLGYNDWVRINLATSMKNIKKAVTALKGIIEQ